MRFPTLALIMSAASLPAFAQMATQSDPIQVEPVLEVPSEDYRTGWVQIGAFSVLVNRHSIVTPYRHPILTPLVLSRPVAA